MNLSYQWISELVESGLAAEELAKRLTFAGCEVGELHDLPGGDKQLVAEVTSNRPDWLCHFGIAREVAALTGKPVRFPAIPDKSAGTGPAVDTLAKISVKDPVDCPRYTARVIKGVKIGPSPDWLCKKLEAVGLRPINNVVDVTNFILFEMNQPLHAFDFDTLRGGEIIVRRAATGEKIKALDGTDCALDPALLVIADAQRPVAVAGVMGGLETEVTAKTVNILLESACFEPRLIRRGSRKLKLLSDSSYRYERGVDPGLCERASARACELIMQAAGGTLCAEVLDTAPDAGKPWEVVMRYARCQALLGCAVGRDEVKRVFAGLGLTVTGESEAAITVCIPSFRRDLTREADLIEEVARVLGYDRVPEKVTLRVERSHEDAAVSGARIIRGALAQAGSHECMTDPFVPERWQGAEGVVRIDNPVDCGRPVLRRSLIPSLLDVRRINRREENVQLFELNRVYRDNPRGETKMLALLDDRGMEYVRGALEHALKALRVTAEKPLCELLAVRPQNGPSTDGLLGVAAELLLNGAVVGRIGIVAREVCGVHDLTCAPAVLEIEFDRLVALPRTDRVYRPLPRFPGIRRDIALVTPEAVRWQEIEAIVRETQGLAPQLESVYRGKGLEPGTKSVAFSFTYFEAERTLTDDEANTRRDALVNALTSRIANARLR